MNGCCHLMAFSSTWLALIIRGSCQAGSKSKQAARKGYPRTQAGIWLSRRGAVTPWLTCGEVGCGGRGVILGTFCPLSDRICFHSVQLVTVNSFTTHRIMFPALLDLALRTGGTGAGSSRGGVSALCCSGPVDDLEKCLGTGHSRVK